MEKKCLIVDDVEVSRFSVTHFLSELNVVAEAAEGVQEAFSKLAEKKYDAIFVDWHIGKESGIELVKKIRSELQLKTPIFVISGVENSDVEAVAIKAGAQGFIEKPTQKDKLEACLKKNNII